MFIYPVSGHWIWGGGWLAKMGFHDFAGSAAVHMVGGVVALESPAIREEKEGADAPLYRAAAPAKERETRLLWIPYYALANRGVGEMRVWINR